MSRPDGGALHTLNKFPGVTVLPPVSRQMDGGFGYDEVPSVQLRIMTNDDAHPERQSARDRFETPIAGIVVVVAVAPPVILRTTPLLEQKPPGSAQIVSRH